MGVLIILMVLTQNPNSLTFNSSMYLANYLLKSG